MSHVLRSAVTAVSLFTCPACATTGSFEQMPPEATNSATPTVRSASPIAPSHPPAIPSAVLSLSPAGATAAILAWEQSRAANPAPTGFRALLFEPSDSRLRIVLNMRNDSPAQAGQVALAAGEEFAQSGWLEGAAALRVPPTANVPEILEVDLRREPLGGPVQSLEPPFVTPWPEPQATPEPGTLTLIAVGLGMIGWCYRRAVRRMEAVA